MTLVIVLLLLVGLWETEAISVEGKVGNKVTIKCSHSNAFSNVKYFCKEPCRDEDDILITNRGMKKYSDGKYSIEDNGNTFTVNISGLTKGDSGTYWCGIERIGLDTYNQVVLTVKDESPSQGTNSVKVSTSEKLVYIGAGLGVVLLALAMALLIFFRHRNRDTNASSGKCHNTVYAMPSIQKQEAPHDATSYSPNEDQQTDGSVVSSASNQHQDTSRDNIYSNITVSPEPEIQPDDLCYSTVSFKEHTDFSNVIPPTATATYSSLKHASIDESTVYCSV